MNEVVLLALIGVVGTALGALGAYLGLVRRVNADVHIARVTLEAGEGTDDRQALRDFQNRTIENLQKDLTECRLKLAQSEAMKYQSLDTLEEAIEVIKTYKEGQLTGAGGSS